jgi:hypothetical protein
VARFGDDETIIYYKIGNNVRKPIIIDICRTTDITRALVSIINPLLTDRLIRVKIDVTGVGSGVVDQMFDAYKNNESVEIIEINFGATAKDENRYSNFATEMYYETKAKLEKGEISMYQDDLTMTQLSTRNYEVDSKSRLKLYPKDKHKKMTGGSPDRADAFVMMCCEPHKKITSTFEFL